MIGADGRSSLVARAVEAVERDRHDIHGDGLFAYFDEFEWRSAEVSLADGTFMFVFPTAARSACIGSATNIVNHDAIKADPEAYFWQVMERDPELAGRVKTATRDGRWRIGELPHGWFRHAGGPGLGAGRRRCMSQGSAVRATASPMRSSARSCSRRRSTPGWRKAAISMPNWWRTTRPCGSCCAPSMRPPSTHRLTTGTRTPRS